MKRIKIVLFILFVSQTVSAVLRTEKINISFSKDDFMLYYDSTGYMNIESINKFSIYPEANEPGLPLFSTDIVIPKNRKYISSSLKYTKKLICSDVKVAKSPIPAITDSISIQPVSSLDTYDLERYPSSNCIYMSSSQWGSVTTLHFLSCPFVYDTKERNLYFIDSIELNIQLDDEQFIGIGKYSYTEPTILKSFVSNNSDIALISSKQSVGNEAVDRIDYVIITSRMLASSFEPLLNWKKTKGLYSKIITIEDIDSNYSGNSLQQKLKKCLYNLYSKNGLRYVLLGGDDTIVPVRGCYGISGSYKDLTIPTDLFYACFGGDFNWDGNKNNIYGEITDNIDLAPSIYVTRVPVRKPDETTAFVRKLLNYEKSPHWSNNILMCGNILGGKYSSEQSDAEAQGDNLYINYIKPYWNGTRVKFYDTYTDFSEGADYDLSAQYLKHQLSMGYSFVDMITHGSQTTWRMEKGESYNSIYGSSQNNAYTTIITTTACLTNAFDSSNEGGNQDPCLSESLIRYFPSGVVAYLGSSRYGWGYSGGTNRLGPSLQYEALFYKNLFSSEIEEKNYGVIVAATKAAMISGSSSDGSLRWLQFALNPIGDPEMPIYISEPQQFQNVEFIDSKEMMTINTGIPGCRICIMDTDSNGLSFYKVYENAQIVSFADFPVKCSICITKQGFVPALYNMYLVQNETLSDLNLCDYDIVKIGTDITSQKEKGNVVFKSGKTVINASTVIMDSGTIVEDGAELIINTKK